MAGIVQQADLYTTDSKRSANWKGEGGSSVADAPHRDTRYLVV